MPRAIPVVGRAVLALVFFFALLTPLRWAQMYVVRTGYQLAEFAGLMPSGGSLGGQILGFNFQREPAWVHWLVWVFASLVVFGPLVIAVLALLTPGAVLYRGTLCGSCGRTLRGLTEPRCPHCGRGFGP